MKILLIGQAPPAAKQRVPYDTTLLYEILSWVGISKEKAQEMFEFEAVSDKFPGFLEKGHKTPSQEDMDKHWSSTLESKVQAADKVWLLGNVARDYFYSKPKTWSCNLEILETLHPSKLNYSRIHAQKEQLITKIESFLSK
jgi:hypothetical protein